MALCKMASSYRPSNRALTATNHHKARLAMRRRWRQTLRGYLPRWDWRGL